MEAENKAISKDLEWSDNATLTISIDGPYFPLAKFRKALDSFIDLLTEVDVSTSERGEATVEWSVDLVKSGSINITALARPVSDEVSGSRAASIIEVIARGIEQLHSEPVTPDGFNDQALKHTKAFGKLIDPDDFAEIRFRSNGWSHGIAPIVIGNVDEITKATHTFYGSLEGTLVSISVARGQQLGLHNSIEGKTIKCFFKDDLFEQAKAALRHRVYVFGLIRQRSHGPKMNIEVEELRILPSEEDLPSIDDLLRKLGI